VTGVMMGRVGGPSSPEDMLAKVVTGSVLKRGGVRGLVIFWIILVASRALLVWRLVTRALLVCRLLGRPVLLSTTCILECFDEAGSKEDEDDAAIKEAGRFICLLAGMMNLIPRRPVRSC